MSARPVLNMVFPLIIRRDNTLIVVDSNFFKLIGQWHEPTRKLDINIQSTGCAGFHWIMDASGDFYTLTSLGLLAGGFWQMFGLKRRRERYVLSTPRRLRVEQLEELLENLIDYPEELPNVADLRNCLRKLSLEKVVTEHDLKPYFG